MSLNKVAKSHWLRRTRSAERTFRPLRLFAPIPVSKRCRGSTVALRFNFFRSIREFPADAFPAAGKIGPHQVRALENCILLPSVNGLYDRLGNPIAVPFWNVARNIKSTIRTVPRNG